MNLVPLSSIPIEVRKDYALALVGMDILDGWEALRVTVAPGDALVPEPELRVLRMGQPRERACATCGRTCWSRGREARCRECYDKTRRQLRGYCAQGHPWTEENVYTRPNGDQYCRTCSNESKRAHRARYGRRDRQAA